MARVHLVDLAGIRHEEVQASIQSGLTAKDCDWGLQWSKKLSLGVVEYLQAKPNWLDTDTIFTGSIAEGLLGPYSDIDAIFLGKETAVKEVVQSLLAEGIPLRSRLPHDHKDLSSGVDWKDQWALLFSRPCTEAGKQILSEQKQKWLEVKNLRRIVKEIEKERRQRNEQFNSLLYLLEPNIKQCSGGIRDLRQALQLLQIKDMTAVDLIPEVIPDEGNVREMFEHYQRYFFNVRWLSYCFHTKDHLVAQVQQEIHSILGFNQLGEFMRDLNRGFSRVSFYGDCLFDFAAGSNGRSASVKSSAKRSQKNLNLEPVGDPLKALSLLEKNPDLRSQYQVRRGLNLWKKPGRIAQGLMLKRILRLQQDRETLAAAFRSRWLDNLIGELRPLVGLVQHDQYHRYTADTHIMKACLEVIHLFSNRRKAKILRPVVAQLTQADFQILMWTAFFHDLAKGRTGDHSVIADQWLKNWLKVWKWPHGEELRWLVLNHLILSDAAFRKNSGLASTWSDLQNKGLNQKRMLRLSVWTALDIIATSPESWNSWKESLILGMVKDYQNPENHRYRDFQSEISKHLSRASSDHFSEFLTKDLWSWIGNKNLKLDMKSFSGARQEQLKILKAHRDGFWLRYFHPHDQPGLLTGIFALFYRLNLGIEEAHVGGVDGQVYDLFRVKTKFKKEVFERLLRDNLADLSGAMKPPPIQLRSVEVISDDEKNIRVILKGRDQAGLLFATTQFLAARGISVKSAVAHTWGADIEDVFLCTHSGNVGELQNQARQFFSCERS